MALVVFNGGAGTGALSPETVNDMIDKRLSLGGDGVAGWDDTTGLINLLGAGASHPGTGGVANKVDLFSTPATIADGFYNFVWGFDGIVSATSFLFVISDAGESFTGTSNNVRTTILPGNYGDARDGTIGLTCMKSGANVRWLWTLEGGFPAHYAGPTSDLTHIAGLNPSATYSVWMPTSNAGNILTLDSARLKFTPF